jgi:hypothetical protein
MAIEMHDAVKIAKTQAQQLFAGEDTAHLMLEEVDFDETKQAWLITLGYDSHQMIKITKVPMEETASFASEMFESIGGEIIEEKTPRVYKVFQIDASDGRLLSMKMRDV